MGDSSCNALREIAEALSPDDKRKQGLGEVVLNGVRYPAVAAAARAAGLLPDTV